MIATTYKLQNRAFKYFMTYLKGRLAVENIELLGHERDLIGLDNKSLITEIEVKISKSDFLADKSKEEKHLKLEHGKDVNYFWYLTDLDLRDIDVPEHAGLLVYNNKQDRIRVVKKAELLHNYAAPVGVWQEIAMKLFYKKTNFGA